MRSIFGIALPCTALVLAALAQSGQKTTKQNEIRDRGQTPVQPPGQSFDYGRIGTQASVPYGPVTLRGTLVDAACQNRTNPNLYKAPESVPATMPPAGAMQAPSAGASSAGGISVNARTLAAERADILAHQTAEMRSRQEDMTCAITASTKEYGLVLPNGRYLDLDYGGDTLANEAVYGTPQGQGMLNGTGPGVKLPVTVKGRVFGDKVIVEELR
jgi:hypothetical protein